MEYHGHPEVEELSDYLKDESDRCAVIFAVAFFDETLAALLGDTNERSFHERLKEALAWGLLSQNEHDDLQILRILRNEFAHDLRSKTLDANAVSLVEKLKTWQIGSSARSLERAISAPRYKLQFVVGTIAFRLQRRSKPSTKAGPLAEPDILDFGSWPPVTSV
jgi:hypothetical protein